MVRFACRGMQERTGPPGAADGVELWVIASISATETVRGRDKQVMAAPAAHRTLYTVPVCRRCQWVLRLRASDAFTET